MNALGYILAAYGTTAILIAWLVIASFWRARRTDEQLARIERSERA